MLSKNLLRTIRQKPFQFLSIVALIMMASFIYVALQGSISSVSYFLTDYTQKMNQEDFFVVLSAPTTNDIKEMISRKGISVSALADHSKSQLMKEYEYTLIDYYDDQLEILSNEFDVTFEGRFYRDVITEVNGQTYDYRVIKQTDSVNLTYILDGELPIKIDEVDIFKTYGPDSRLGMMVSVLESCTETVFYTMSVYYLTVRISKTRWTLAGALIATFAGLVASILCSAMV